MVSTKAGFDIDSETYYRGSDTHRFDYDLDDTPPCMAVVSALSSVLDTSPMSMDPIGEVVDTDSLDALVRDSAAADGNVEVSLTQAGYEVTISSDGTVDVSPVEDERPRTLDR